MKDERMSNFAVMVIFLFGVMLGGVLVQPGAYWSGVEDGKNMMVEHMQDADLARQNAVVNTVSEGGVAVEQGFIAWRTSEGTVVIENYGG